MSDDAAVRTAEERVLAAYPRTPLWVLARVREGVEAARPIAVAEERRRAEVTIRAIAKGATDIIDGRGIRADPEALIRGRRAEWKLAAVQKLRQRFRYDIIQSAELSEALYELLGDWHDAAGTEPDPCGDYNRW